MAVEPTAIDGLLVVRWPTHADDRGWFRQAHQQGELEAVLGRQVTWRQTNHARSAPGVLRGFHAEPWDKCVYVTRGTVMAAVADIREDSPTFAHVETFHLGDPPGEHLALFISEGLANSYCSYGDGDVDYLYQVSEEYHPVDKRSIAWDDADLAVPWPIGDPLLSQADRNNPTLRSQYPDHPRLRTNGDA
jgi:dTDP-4-dehydrorhamnose 3,5-epimerase